MTNLSRHPVLRAIYGASQAIEKCGASRELTDAVMAVTALYAPAEGLLDHIASLERQLEDAKAQFRAETLRTSEYAVMIDKMIARLCVEHEPGAWSRSCESCALVLEARALRMKPININPLAEMQAQLAERTREVGRLREALAELVACKDLIDTAESTSYITDDDVRRALVLDYQHRKPLAWAAARAALAAEKGEQT